MKFKIEGNGTVKNLVVELTNEERFELDKELKVCVGAIVTE